MTKDNSFSAVMARKAEIIRNAIGVDYQQFESGSIAFDYEKMMASTGYTLEDVAEIQRGFAIGNTPLIELKNITALVRKISKDGYGARIFVKDEAANPSGSFKVRRAATSIYHAKRMGYKGALSATSGNYGAAVASCCSKSGLKCVVVQECYDSRGVGQPEIIEKARKCEALGAEVVQGRSCFIRFFACWKTRDISTPRSIPLLASRGSKRLGLRSQTNAANSSAKTRMWSSAPTQAAAT